MVTWGGGSLGGEPWQQFTFLTLVCFYGKQKPNVAMSFRVGRKFAWAFEVLIDLRVYPIWMS